MKLKKFSLKSVISMLLVCVMVIGMLPTMGVFAAQTSPYIDPAENWLTANGRTNELDVNANTTYETQYCCVCNMTTTVLTYRVPEYTRSGETALNRSVKYSDGTCIDGESSGNLDDGTPGIDASYTGYHWTKAVCQNCGTINTVNGFDAYDFNNNVYALNACDHNFFVAFDATTHVPYDDDNHLTTLKAGEYCQFCKGTYAVGVRGLADHNFAKDVDGQVGNNRFYVDETCEDCGYETSEYVTAKAVVSSYYGVEDGEAHTLEVTDLSDSGVRTSIRYGTEADRCTRTSAPNYTQPGYYTVYYEIDYSYSGEVMTENGVSYVWIIADDEESNSANGTIIILPQAHEHEFHYLEEIAPSCTALGYERFQCAGCGELDKRNYIPATGHDYDDVVIREATCKQGGLVLTLCGDCGDFYQTTTELGDHIYNSVKHNATCQSVGYTEHICEVCGDNYITNMTPIISHSYERVTKKPTCVDRGYTTSTCTMCGYNYVSDYTEAIGHSWDEGTTVTNSTCDGEGVIEYKCNDCDEKMIKATSANGHNPGDEATCTQDRTKEKAIFLDELWQLIGASSNKLAAEFVLEVFKIIRGYGGSAICATQDLNDFFALDGGKYGKGIINNAKTKVILNLEEDEAARVQDILKLSETELMNITHFERGNGLISTNSNNVTVEFRASEFETELITTDRAELQAILSRRKEQKLS